MSQPDKLFNETPLIIYLYTEISDLAKKYFLKLNGLAYLKRAFLNIFFFLISTLFLD
jgi:hypothetical protein